MLPTPYLTPCAWDLRSLIGPNDYLINTKIESHPTLMTNVATYQFDSDRSDVIHTITNTIEIANY